MKRFATLSLCALALLLLLSLGARASERRLTMGALVRLAPIIVVGDTRPGGERGLDIILTPRAVLKGQATAGREMVFASPDRLSSSGRYLPREATGIAVLLGSPLPGAVGVQDSLDRVIDTYSAPAEIEALRQMVRIEALPSERERLLELSRRWDDPTFRTQLVADLRGMRERASFPILLGLMKSPDEAQQKAAAEAIAFIGDARGVPALIKALDSPSRAVAVTAANALISDFPGAPGVDAALRREPVPPLLAETILWFKSQRGGPAPTPRTLYQRISRLREKGDEGSASALFPEALGDAQTLESLVRFDTAWLERALQSQPELQAPARRALLPLLSRMAAEENYLHDVDAAHALRALRHPEAVEPLLSLLRFRGEGQWLYDESARIAAFALADLGEEARAKAVELLRARPDWKALAPMFEPFASREDEARALAALLDASLAGESLSATLDWAVYRLGDLRSASAAGVLSRWADKRSWHGGAPVTAALLAIGGAEVEKEMLPLLGAEHDDQARRIALQVLVGLQRERALPLLRRLVRERDPALKVDAAMRLGGLGTREDIALLRPLGDFWTGDRDNHDAIRWALIALRERHGYDLNGPLPERG